jgi:hypothetical protein
VIAEPLLRFCPPTWSNARVVRRTMDVVWPDAHTVLDPTYDRGGFWKPPWANTALEVTGLVNEVDMSALPYADGAYDVVVIDPPHNGDAGARSIMGQRYGTYRGAELEDAVRRAARQAYRVGRLGCLIKVTDAIHAQRLQRMSQWVTEELGEPFDVIHRVRKSPLIDPRWGRQQHAYNNGSSFLAYRK